MTKNPEIFLHFNSKPLIASRFPLKNLSDNNKVYNYKFFPIKFLYFQMLKFPVNIFTHQQLTNIRVKGKGK